MANQRKEPNAEKYIQWLQRCRWRYGSIFIRL